MGLTNLEKTASMKGNLANNGRCPKCTLKPPCKHYESVEQLMGTQSQSSKISELG